MSTEPFFLETLDHAAMVFMYLSFVSMTILFISSFGLTKSSVKSHYRIYGIFYRIGINLYRISLILSIKDFNWQTNNMCMNLFVLNRVAPKILLFFVLENSDLLTIIITRRKMTDRRMLYLLINFYLVTYFVTTRSLIPLSIFFYNQIGELIKNILFILVNRTDDIYINLTFVKIPVYLIMLSVFSDFQKTAVENITILFYLYVTCLDGIARIIRS